MRTLTWGTTFLRAFKRLMNKRPDLRQEVEKTLRLLVQDPFIPQLQTHKLKGKLSGSWACSVGDKDENKKDHDIFLIEIGTHGEVY